MPKADNLFRDERRELGWPLLSPGVVIHNPGQFLLALELSMLDANGMAQRFDRGTLIDIQETLSLEPETASRLAMAVDLATRDDATT
jgi:hypothetical protein